MGWVWEQLCEWCLCGSTYECRRTTHHLSGGSQLADLSPQGPTSPMRKALDEGQWAAVGFNKVAGYIWACVAYSQLKCSQRQLMFDIFPPLLHIYRGHWKLLKGITGNVGEHICSLQLFCNTEVSAQLLALGFKKHMGKTATPIYQKNTSVSLITTTQH